MRRLSTPHQASSAPTVRHHAQHMLDACLFHRMRAPFLPLGATWKVYGRPGMRRTRRFAAGDDPCGWERAPEWWGTQGGGWGRHEGQVVFQEVSRVGNGIVQVTSHDCEAECRAKGERKGLQRLEWRVLRFNQITRQSVAKVEIRWDPIQKQMVEQCQAHCLAFEYLKTMAALAITTMAARIEAKEQVKVLCVGLGGGSLPTYLQHTWNDRCQCHVVEMDETVVNAAFERMGLSSCVLQSKQLQVFVEDGVKFIQDSAQDTSSTPYDLIVIDAFDGEDSIPEGFLRQDAGCLAQMGSILHPSHGTVLVNMHGGKITSTLEWEIQKLTGSKSPGYNLESPLGRQIHGVCQSYISALGPQSAFTVSCSKQDNIVLVVSNIASLSKDKMALLAREVVAEFRPEFSLEDRVQRHFWNALEE